VPGWILAALPLLASVALVLDFTGSAVPLVVWAVVTVIWLVLMNLIGHVNNQSAPRLTHPTGPAGDRGHGPSRSDWRHDSHELRCC
jgi:hypothetical protein